MGESKLMGGESLYSDGIGQLMSACDWIENMKSMISQLVLR